jgi:hypothetical protein
MIRKLRNLARAVHDTRAAVELLHLRIAKLQEAVARVEARQVATQADADLHNSEFSCYSQGGADGILSVLTRDIPPRLRTFIEFGVEDYQEANTRFLLRAAGWTGLVMDGSDEQIKRIRSEHDFWKFGLQAVQAFITRENINSLIVSNGYQGEIGLISIDIDGNDYWVWESLAAVQPVIVVIEYNHRWGAERSVAVPYDPAFRRAVAHHSMIYFGASLRALVNLGRRKGYSFVGCAALGNDAFFVRSDRLPPHIRALTVEEGFVAGTSRETRDERGEFVYLTAEQEQGILKSLPVVQVE